MNELALFAGAGGGILGGKLLGWTTICAVEWEPYAAAVLCARQNEGFLAPFPIWDDVRTFDGHPWRGRVDVVSGGFPCQDISAAGKGAGIDGERSGLWREMARIICEVGPRFVFVENSPMLTSRGLRRVLGDLAALGYDARWGVLGAVDAGAPHKRDRIWIVAYAVPSRQRWEQQPEGSEGAGNVADSNGAGLEGRKHKAGADAQGWQEPHGPVGERGGMADTQRIRPHTEKDKRIMEGEGARELCVEQLGSNWGAWWAVEPDLGRVANGVAARVDRLKAIGNGQVPAVAALAWRILSGKQPQR